VNRKKKQQRQKKKVRTRPHIFTYMAFIDVMSCKCTKSELDLFVVQPMLVCMGCTAKRSSSDFVQYQLISIVQNNAPHDFEVSGMGKDYIYMENIMLYVCTKYRTMMTPHSPLT